MKSDVVKSSRPETNRYIEMDKKGYGPTYLASISLTLGVHNVHPSLNAGCVTEMIKLTSLMMKLSRKNGEEVIDLMNNVIDRYESLRDDSNVSEWMPRLPRDRKELRRFLLEGRNSILKNLAHPPVESINGHSSVSIIEILIWLLASGYKVEMFGADHFENWSVGQNYSKINQCLLAKKC